MIVEKLEIPDQKNYCTLLRQLQPGEALRLRTPVEYRSAMSAAVRIGREKNLKFGTRSDGSDVLIFLKPAPEKIPPVKTEGHPV